MPKRSWSRIWLRLLNARADIVEDKLENSSAYLQGWIDELKYKDAKGWIIRAASQAQRAAHYILGVREDGEARRREATRRRSDLRRSSSKRGSRFIGEPAQPALKAPPCGGWVRFSS